MKKMKKFFASLLVLCMVLTLPNMAALATEGTGTEENPVVIETLGETTTSLVGGAEQTYYYYSYTAPSTLEGTAIITVSVKDVTAGAYYAINMDNTTTDDYGQVIYHAGWGYDTTTDSVKIAAGETVLFKVLNFSSGDAYPSLDITWTAALESVGTVDSPEDMGLLYNYGSYGNTYETSLVPGTGYYYSYIMEETGDFVAYVNYNWSSIATEEELLPEITITNKTTDVTTCLSQSDYVYEFTQMGWTMTYDAVKIEASKGDELLIMIGSDASAETVVIGWDATLVLPAAAGSSLDNPIVITGTSDTVTVPANSEYYISFPMEYDGATVTVTPPDPSAWYDVTIGGTYLDKDDNGVASGTLVYYYAMGGVVISVINGSWYNDMDFTIEVVIPEGTYSNPEEIVMEEGKTDASVEVELEAGHGAYYLEWVATADGVLSMDISSSVEDVWYYAMYTDNENSTEYYYSYGNSPDYVADPNAVIYVEEGDVVTFVVMAMDFANDAATVDATLTLDLALYGYEDGSILSAIQSIENAEEGTEVVVVLADEDGDLTAVIPAEVLEAAKGKDVDLVIQSNVVNVYWVINGKDITTAKDIDLNLYIDAETSIPEALLAKVVDLDSQDYTTFSLADNDDFGLTAAYVMLVSDEYEGSYISLYYYNKDGNLECVGSCEVDVDGYIGFAFTHASDYVLVMSDDEVEVGTIVKPDVVEPDTPDNGTEEDTVPDNGDVSMTLVYVIVLMGAALVVAGFVSKKKFA